jgi:hypothetical protein
MLGLEEEGDECLSDEADDDDDATTQQDEEDDWLVPNGYLSDGEGIEEDEVIHIPKDKVKKEEEDAANKKVCKLIVSFLIFRGLKITFPK